MYIYIYIYIYIMYMYIIIYIYIYIYIHLCFYILYNKGVTVYRAACLSASRFFFCLAFLEVGYLYKSDCYLNMQVSKANKACS